MYPSFQQREIPIGLILMQHVMKCQSDFFKKIYGRHCISFTIKQHSCRRMEDTDLDGLVRDLGLVLKSELKEAVESLLKGRDVC